MKTFLLSTLFAFLAYSGEACSCIYISDYFCPSASWINSNGGGPVQYIAQVKVTSRYSYYMDVEVVDNLQNNLPGSLTILGQDGLNCNEYLNPFEEGKTYIVMINESHWEEDVYDLSGCGKFWLPVNDGKVQGNIAEGVQEQSYEEFRQELARCAGITSAEEPKLPSLLLYPNPTSGEMFFEGIEAGDVLNYTIYSYAGQLVKAGLIFGGSSPSLSLAGLPDGLYLLRLQSGKAVITRRIVLRRD